MHDEGLIYYVRVFVNDVRILIDMYCLSAPGGCSPSVLDFAFLSENPNQNKENRI